MTNHHDDFAGMVDGWLLGSLDAADAERFAAHLEQCADCRRDVRELSAVAEGLGRAVPQVAPPPALRARVIEAATTTMRPGPTAVTPRAAAPVTRPAVAPAAPVIPPAVGPVAAATPITRWSRLALAATLVAAVLAWTTWQTRNEAAVVRAERDEAAGRVAALEAQVRALESAVATVTHTRSVLAAQDLARVELAGQTPAPGAAGRVFWSAEYGLVFAATNLPPLPPGQVYQLWVVADSPISAGILAAGPSSGVGTINSPPVAATPKAFAVTMEPAGGRPAPTGPMLLMGAMN